MSAGTRVTTSLYDGAVPRVRLVLDRRGGHIAGWEAVLERADTPPAEIDPGTLGGAVRGAGLPLAYAGRTGMANREAVVAADRGGGVARAALYQPRDVLAGTLRLWRDSRFLTALLPPGAAGRSVLDGLLAARRPNDLVLVVQQPREPRRRLLAAGAAGLEGGTTLRSDSTRTDGLVLPTDIAPTVLDRLGVPVPDHVDGEPIEAAGDATAAELDDRRARLAVVGPRRWPVTLGGLARRDRPDRPVGPGAQRSKGHPALHGPARAARGALAAGGAASDRRARAECGARGLDRRGRVRGPRDRRGQAAAVAAARSARGRRHHRCIRRSTSRPGRT